MRTRKHSWWYVAHRSENSGKEVIRRCFFRSKTRKGAIHKALRKWHLGKSQFDQCRCKRWSDRLGADLKQFGQFVAHKILKQGV